HRARQRPDRAARPSPRGGDSGGPRIAGGPSRGSTGPGVRPGAAGAVRPRRRRRDRGGQPPARRPEAARDRPSARLRAAAPLARRAGRRAQSDGDADVDGGDPPAAGRERVDDRRGRARHGARHGDLGPGGRPRPRPQDRGGRAPRDRGRCRGRRGVAGQPGGRVTPVLELDDVAVAYGKRRALEGVSLSVGPGEIVTLLGANGAGKSTTLRAVSGLVRPTRGRILYEGRDITHVSADATVAAGVSHVPEGREIFPEFTVRENLLVGGHTVE